MKAIKFLLIASMVTFSASASHQYNGLNNNADAQYTPTQPNNMGMQQQQGYNGWQQQQGYNDQGMQPQVMTSTQNNIPMLSVPTLPNINSQMVSKQEVRDMISSGRAEWVQCFNDLHGLVQQIQNSCNAAYSISAELKQTNDQLKQENDTLRDTNNRLTQETDSLRETLQGIQAELDGLRSIKEKYQALEANYNQMEVDIRQLAANNEVFVAFYDKAHNVTDDYPIAIDAAKEEVINQCTNEFTERLRDYATKTYVDEQDKKTNELLTKAQRDNNRILGIHEERLGIQENALIERRNKYKQIEREMREIESRAIGNQEYTEKIYDELNEAVEDLYRGMKRLKDHAGIQDESETSEEEFPAFD